MARTQTMVQLNEELLVLLDRRAARDGLSRSQLIREAVEAFLAQDREREIDRQIIEGYTRMPQGGEYDIDEWGDLGKTVTALTVDAFRRLDEEERAAGFDPW
ncbi:MAG: CopG family ribbon-helix-helix protein [Egibacteraceae bacterium]